MSAIKSMNTSYFLQISSHVKAIDAIYQGTDFMGIRNISFMVKRIRVSLLQIGRFCILGLFSLSCEPVVSCLRRSTPPMMRGTSPTHSALPTLVWRSFWSWTRSRTTTTTAWLMYSLTEILTMGCWVWPGWERPQVCKSYSCDKQAVCVLFLQKGTKTSFFSHSLAGICPRKCRLKLIKQEHIFL